MPGAGGAKKMKDRWGKLVNWRIEKGKAGIHEGAVGNYLYRFHQPRTKGTDPIIPINSADFYMDTIVAGQKLGCVVTNGTWLSIVDEQGEEIEKAQGMENLAYRLYEDAQEKAAAGDSNSSLMNIIRKTCFRKAGINLDYDWD